MRRSAVLLLVSSVALTGGCVTPRQSATVSLVAPAISLDAVRRDAVRELVALYPPAVSRLYVASGGRAFDDALAADLRRAGYAVVERAGEADAEPGYTLRIAVDRVDDGLLAVRLYVGTTTLSRAYLIDATGANPQSAWSIDLTIASADLRERVELLASAPVESDADRRSPGAEQTVASMVGDIGSPAWVLRLRSGPHKPYTLGPAPTPVPVDLVVPAASADADRPPIPPRLTRATAPVPAAPVAMVSASKATAAATAAPGPWRVQLGAYDAPRDAQLYARDLLHRHAAVLASASPYFVRVGSRLPRTVVRVGPYATRADAVSVCLGLRANRADCIVARG